MRKLFLSFALLLSTKSQEINETFVEKLPLEIYGNHYSLSLTIGSITLRDVILDTGTTKLYVRKCDDDSTYNSTTSSASNSSFSTLTQPCFDETKESGTFTVIGSDSCPSPKSENTSLIIDSKILDIVIYDYALITTINLDASGIVTNHSLLNLFSEIATYDPLHDPLINVGGWMGLASDFNNCGITGYDYSPFETAVRSVRPDLPWFSIDFWPEDGESSISLGGYDVKTYGQKFQWGQYPASSTLINYYTFGLFNPMVCGNNIAPVSARALIGLVDTGAACLTVPSELFDSLVAWLPLVANPCPMDLCKVSAENAQRGLPSISFMIGYGTPRISLPLNSLLLPIKDEEVDQELCLRRGKHLLDSDIYFSRALPTIVFGTIALRSLYTVVDMDYKRVGFAQKDNFFFDDSNCAAKPQCSSASSYDPILNACESPKCGNYFILVTSDGECELNLAEVIFFWTICCVVLCADLQLGFVMNYLAVTGLGHQGARLRGWEYRMGRKVLGLMEFIGRACSSLRYFFAGSADQTTAVVYENQHIH